MTVILKEAPPRATSSATPFLARHKAMGVVVLVAINDTTTNLETGLIIPGGFSTAIYERLPRGFSVLITQD